MTNEARTIMWSSALGTLLGEDVIARTADVRARFESALPFKHVVIDDFFESHLADELLAAFPAFEAQYAMNEFGHVGRKAVVSNIAGIGESYRRVDDAISGRPFLDWLGAVTGIESLQNDPQNFGGGTHENRDGQGLDPHVDFNYHPTTGQHRRLNLIVYLNKGWDDAWGGALEIHSDPRRPDQNVVVSYSPSFNRAIIFETNEYSWHGFRRIRLPQNEQHRSRKSLSLYFYTPMSVPRRAP